MFHKNAIIINVVAFFVSQSCSPYAKNAESSPLQKNLGENHSLPVVPFLLYFMHIFVFLYKSQEYPNA